MSCCEQVCHSRAESCAGLQHVHYGLLLFMLLLQLLLLLCGLAHSCEQLLAAYSLLCARCQVDAAAQAVQLLAKKRQIWAKLRSALQVCTAQTAHQIVFLQPPLGTACCLESTVNTGTNTTTYRDDVYSCMSLRQGVEASTQC